MRTIITAVLVVPLTIITLGCSNNGGPGNAAKRGLNEASQKSDSTTEKAYSQTFFDMHVEILDEINNRLDRNASDPVALEADAIVKTAERLYLEGKFQTAIEVLAEAKTILGQAN